MAQTDNKGAHWGGIGGAKKAAGKGDKKLAPASASASDESSDDENQVPLHLPP